ncbi:MAG: acyl-CoA dehydrogenase family protein, partial [Nocardioides sp.]
MSLMQSLRPGGKHGLTSKETRDPIGYAVAALSRVAQSDLLDRVGLRRRAEQAVFTTTRGGFKTITAANRTFTRAGRRGSPGARPTATAGHGPFDLTPTEDEQMLVDVVTELAREVLRPAAAEADEACAAPDVVLKAGLEVGLPILGVPEALGGIAEERSAMAGTLVAEALAHGDMGLAVASLAPGSVATAVGLWGTDAQQQTYLPAFTGADAPAAAIALTEPTVLFDVLRPATTAVRTDAGFVLNGVKSAVPCGSDAELFVIGAELEGRPVLFLVESSTPGIEVVADPAMGVRAAGLTRLQLSD